MAFERARVASAAVVLAASSAGAVAALQKLINVDKIMTVFTAFTPLTLPQLPIAEEKKVIVVAASMEHPDLTKSPWAVRMTPTAEKAGPIITSVAEKLGLKTAATLAEENEAVARLQSESAASSGSTAAKRPERTAARVCGKDWQARAGSNAGTKPRAMSKSCFPNWPSVVWIAIGSWRAEASDKPVPLGTRVLGTTMT